jgi:heme-degrading monooxygenase HmoA
MFTRVVEIHSKPGKSRDLASTITEQILPILKNQPGFIDEIILISDVEPNRILAQSFWDTREDADRYNREQYAEVSEILQPLIDKAPMVQTFTVQYSMSHKVAAGKAA